MTLPGEAVPAYDVSQRLGTDYYAVFADIPDADRAVWQRAQAFVDEVGDRMHAAWDAADYPLDLVRRLGELDLLNDGVEHPLVTPFSPLAAGLVTMEDHERAAIQQALDLSNGSVRAAADRLQVARSTLYRRIRALGLSAAS